MITRLTGKRHFAMLIFCSAAFGAPAVAQAAQDDAAGWQFVVAPYLLVPHERQRDRGRDSVRRGRQTGDRVPVSLLVVLQ